MTANSKNTIRLETSKTPKIVNRKLVFFLTCSIVFGSLSFVSYKPLEASKNDYSVALVNNSKTSLELVDKTLRNLESEFLAKGMAKKMMKLIEQYALSKNIYSLKADTNHDNIPMMKIFEKLGYSFCGIVYIRKSPRRAYEKVLKK